MTTSSNVGFVIIGRNEGERLKRCIASVQRQSAGPIVYVDSGSTDGSVEYAQSRDVVSIALDMTRPFTMGRARNAGFAELMRRWPELTYVQFVDGDCEIDDGWVPHAQAWLQEHAELAAVCGHMRERYPQASRYNRLFDIEIRGPYGAVYACGGVAMYRTADFAASHGFEERMIAGEEPELCVRLRRAGRGIWRSKQPMALHDADMHTFKQWWMRAVRCGHAYADGFAMQGRTPERHCAREIASCMFYGLLLPGACAGGFMVGVLVPGAGFLTVLSPAVLGAAVAKVAVGAYRHRKSLGDSSGDSALYAVACVVSKTPEALGVIKFARNRLARRQSRLIEYRRATKA